MLANKFPLMIDLAGNNCIVFGGGNSAYVRVMALLAFNAKITVISPEICDELRQMDKDGIIRYIPRKYYRGDCSLSYLCVAATGNDTVNISISDECKAKSISVNVVSPPAFGTFQFPTLICNNDVTISIQCDDGKKLKFLSENFEKILPVLLDKLESN